MITNQQVKKYFGEKRNGLAREAKGMELLEELVLPLMPHTVEECFEVNYLDFGYTNPPSYLRIDFNRKPDAPMDRAHGTVTKVIEALESNGWRVDSPVIKLYGKSTIEVDIMATILYDGKDLTLMMDFENLEPTANCRLEEYEEEVAEVPAVEAHMETKMKLVCDEEKGQ